LQLLKGLTDMITIALLLAAGQLPPAADLDATRWRSFVHAAVAIETPFAGRMLELHRSVAGLLSERLPRPPRAITGPSGM
jgi:hypothetical protein